MKKIHTYQSYLKGIVYFLLCSQLWVTGLQYSSWMHNGESDLIELAGSEDFEYEKEENKKEKEHKVRSDLHLSEIFKGALANKEFYLRQYISIHHPEITTPPPELPTLIS